MPRIILAALLLIGLCAPSLAGDAGHEVRLLDGTVLQGRVLLLDGDRLVMATAFQDSLAIPRSQVAVILLEAGAAPPPAPAGDAASIAKTKPVAKKAELGRVEIAIKGDPVRSSARYRRKEDRPDAIELNTIHLRVFVDGELVLSRSDDTIEKDFQESNWHYLRNTHQFETVSFDIPSGRHEVQIVIGNRMDLLKQGERQSELVSAELILKEITVRPGQTTRVAIKGKGSRFKYGKFEMELLSSR